MIIGLRAAQPDYREVLLMTHQLFVAPAWIWDGFLLFRSRCTESLTCFNFPPYNSRLHGS